ncbi:MAG: polysaccharide deacetylase family protein [Planctomycetaceae bacterium]
MNDELVTRRRGLAGIVSYAALVTAGRSLQGPATLVDSRRRLIISSDDAGMCPAVNEGTILGLEHGQITSASIMTCCPCFNEFAEYAVRHPEFDYGVHLVLTCDLRQQTWGAVAEKSLVPSLLDEHGLLPMWPSKNVSPEEVEIELRAQIEKAINAGIRVTHIDHHMWVMFHSIALLKLYVRLGIEYGLPIRISRTVPRQVVNRGEEFVSVYRQQVEKVEKHGLPVLEFIESENYSVEPEKKREYFLTQIQRLPRGTSEIAAHCSRWTHGAQPPDFSRREVDTQFWTSLEVKECLAGCSIQPTTFDKFI